MAAQKWQSDPSLAEQVFKEFYSFSFFKAVQLLESFSPEKKPLGQALVPAEEAVRFSVKPGLSFPPSEISNLTPANEYDPAAMEVAFLGLIGPSGVLPYWYSELVLERLREKDTSLKAFLDLFHHRLVSLFYLAWKKHKFTVNYQPGAKDRLSRHLLSLTGLGTPRLSERIGLPEESLTFYSGHFSRATPSALAIQAAVEHFSGVSARIEQFINRVLPLEPEDLTRIGKANGQLGVKTIVGSQVWECQTKFRVVLGPLKYSEFQRYLPSGDMLKPIFALVKYMVGIEYEFEIRLVLKREEVPLCTLGGTDPTSPRLGWSTWTRDSEFLHADNPFITFQEADL